MKKKQLAALVFSFVFIGAARAQLVVDAWAPPALQAPIELRVNDPITGDRTFQPVHGTLLPDGRVMLFGPVGVNARAAWFVPTPIGQPLPPMVRLTPDYVPVDVDPPVFYTDPVTGDRWHVEETIFCSGHAPTADGGIFVAGGTLLYSYYEAATQTTVNWIYGMPNVTQYSLSSGTWSRGENMRGTGETGSNLRWYGTVTRLADQRMLVSSGFELASIQVRRPGQPVEHHGTSPNRSVEVMLPAGGGHVVSTHTQSPLEIWNPDYTHAFQVPYGPPLVPSSTVLMFGAAGVPVYLMADAPPGTGWITLSDRRRPGTVATDAPNHGTASALLPMRANNFEWGYANGSVLQMGGGLGSQMERSIDFFEMSSGRWAPGADLGVRRRFPATVLLPDGKVMMVSGYDATNVNPLIRNAHYLDLRPPLSANTFTTGIAAQGEVRAIGVMATIESTYRGWQTAHCSACMPPIDGPTTATTWSMPSLSFSRRRCDSTMSRMPNFGNCIRGCALLLLGDVVRPLPMASVAMTKYLFVSSDLPGPIMKSSRWWLPVSAVTMRIALDFAAFSVPWVT